MVSSEKKPVTSDVTIRVLAALPFIPVVYFVFKGGMISALLCLAITAVMSFEASSIPRHTIKHPFAIAQWLMVMAPAILILLPSSIHETMPPSYLLGMMIVGLAYTAKDISAKILMAFLAASVFSLVSIILIDEGVKWLILAVATIIATDTGAYFGGRRFGGPKLAPMISPSKTWSGAICGMIAGGLAGYSAGYILGFSPAVAGLVSILIADLSIGGDLLESWFKRRHNVKDSGRILPGHGGFLDRFDGFLLTLPLLNLALIFGLGKG